MVPAGAIAFGLVVVTNAAKLTVAVARIALPPIPVPGETVTNDELLDPVVTPDEVDDASPTWKAIIASVPESAARLQERSLLTRQLLIGFLSAGALVLSIGAIAVVVQGHFFIHSMIVAGLVAVICGFRSRLYAERWCSWALLAAAIGGADRRDGPLVPVEPGQRLDGAGDLHGGGVGCTDRGGRRRRSAANVAGHQADLRTDRWRRHRCGDPAAAVDRGGVRPAAKSAVALTKADTVETAGIRRIGAYRSSEGPLS